MDINTDVDSARYPNMRKMQLFNLALAYLGPFATWLEGEKITEDGKALLLRYLEIDQTELEAEEKRWIISEGRRLGVFE